MGLFARLASAIQGHAPAGAATAATAAAAQPAAAQPQSVSAGPVVQQGAGAPSGGQGPAAAVGGADPLELLQDPNADLLDPELMKRVRDKADDISTARGRPVNGMRTPGFQPMMANLGYGMDPIAAQEHKDDLNAAYKQQKKIDDDDPPAGGAATPQPRQDAAALGWGR